MTYFNWKHINFDRQMMFFDCKKVRVFKFSNYDRQMMYFDELTNEFLVLSSAEIVDFPEFRHRGLLVDTSRNFVDLEVIKTIIDGLALSKVKIPDSD